MSILYTQAAQCLAPCLVGYAKSSLKSRALQSDNQPATMALASQTLKFKNVIDEVLRGAGGLQISSLVNNEALGYVLIYEMLFGSGTIRGGGGAKRSVIEHRDTLVASLDALRDARGAHCNEDLLPEAMRNSAMPSSLPRFGRVNQLKTNDINRVLRQVPGSTRDVHLPYVICLPLETKGLHAHPLVVDGTLILQDKSSCFPAQALVSVLKASSFFPCDVLDATAAPGNKTTQLAALLGGKGGRKVYAMDRSLERFNLLRRRIEQAGAQKICEAIHGDFLSTTPSDPRFANVKAILLDPSCSGSGTVMRNVDRLVEEAEDEASVRVRGLVDFQIRALSHALSFPQVRFVSYSTCSVFQAENEAVVAAVLENKRNEWALVRALPEWPRRGVTGALPTDEAELVARADPKHDNTGGFFVAVFARLGTSPSESAPKPLSDAAKAKRKRKKQAQRQKQGGKRARSDSAGAAAAVPEDSAPTEA